MNFVLFLGLSLYAVASLGSMAMMSVGAGVYLLAFTAYWVRKRLCWPLAWRMSWACPEFRMYLLASLALLASCALSLGVAQFWPVSYSGEGGGAVQVSFFKDLSKLWYLFWPILLALGLRELRDAQRKQVLWAWLGAFGVVSLIGVQQYFTGWPRVQPIPMSPGRFHATLFFGHHLSTASILIFPWFAALDLLAAKREKAQRFLIVLAGLGAFALFATYSRTLWLALPVGLLLWLLLRFKGRRRWAVLALAVISLGVTSQIPFIQSRMNESLGVGTRKNLWSANLEFFSERPFTGVGFRHNQELASYYLLSRYSAEHPNEPKQARPDLFVGHAHNVFLEQLAGTGLLGVICWVFWCGVIFWLLKRALSQKQLPIAHGLLCAWVVLHLNGLTQVNFWEAKVQHQMMWSIAWVLASFL